MRRKAVVLLAAIWIGLMNVAAYSQLASTEASREAFTQQYRRTGAMMGSACNKAVAYGSGSDSFALHCPGIRRDTALQIMHDKNSPIVRELRNQGFRYFVIRPAGGDVPEVRLGQ